jgi:hypothetical protein
VSLSSGTDTIPAYSLTFMNTLISLTYLALTQEKNNTFPDNKKKKKQSQKKQNKQKTQKLYTLISLKEDLKTEWHNQQKDSCQNLLEKATYFPSYCSIQS